MRIAIDGVKFSGKPCGLTNIAVSIITELSKSGQHEIFVFVKSQPHPEIEVALKKLDQVSIIVEPPKFLKYISIFWSIFQINNLVKKVNPDLFIAPNFLVSPWRFNKKIKTVVFVHDLVNKEYPETMHWFNRLHMSLLFKYSIKKANVIWCNSQYTANKLNYYYHNVVTKKRVFVGSGIQNIHTEAIVDDATINQFKPYMLFVGTIEPRKNVKFMLQVYEEIHNQYNLVMIGGKGWGAAAAEVEKMLADKPQLASKIHWVSNIDINQLRNYYVKAEFLISTSLNEGLGLPILEAMANGCAVITPKNSAFIEIVDGVEVTIDNWDVNTWVLGIDELISNKNKYVDNGYKQVKKYNWSYIIDSFSQFIN